MKKFKVFLLFFLSSLTLLLPAQPQALSASEIKLSLKKLSIAGSVLYIAAHPDDENTRLLSYLANEKLVQTSYLSLTRGDGGQNLIGTEQGDLLGMIRTQELLAARNTDKAKQYFSRARDFGFSKSPEETFTIWNKDSILSDMVWIIRNLRPEVMICRFPANGDGGHGHHTASAILAEMAFDASADSSQFKWQLQYVKPWKTKRLLWNVFVRDTKTDVSKFYFLDIGAYNPLLGKSYGELAAESRSMHKTQGFGSARTRGKQLEYFKHIKGDSAKSNDIFEDLIFDVAHLEGAKAYSSAIIEVLQAFNDDAPYHSVNALVKAMKAAEEIREPYWKENKKEEIKTLIQQCLGLWLEASAKEKYNIPGTELKVNITALNRSLLPIKLESISIAGLDILMNIHLNNNNPFSKELSIVVPKNTAYTSPFWLKNKGNEGLYHLENLHEVGMPENQPALEVIFHLNIAGEQMEFKQALTFKWVDPTEGEKQRNIELVPPVVVNFQSNSYLFKPNETKLIQVQVKTFSKNIQGILKLELPEGWKASPIEYIIDSLQKDAKNDFIFSITAPTMIKDGNAKAIVKIDDQSYSYSFTEIDHSHVPKMVLLKESSVKLVNVDYSLKVNKVGYIIGAGDEVAACIEQMGCTVEQLNESALSKTNFSKYDVIVTGIRAYNTNDFLADYYSSLMNYVFNGGTLLVQYNTNNFLSTVKSNIGPYPFKISRDRVTVENVPVIFKNSAHQLLNKPNKITVKDFEGWIQERGLYFATNIDKTYETVLLMNDPGEKPLEGSIIVGKYGKGYFIYTGLSFFRQLPGGVPGAYRLFANMLSIGK